MEETLKIGNGLAVTEEVDGSVGLGNGCEKLEDDAEATNTEEGELRTCITESRTECECHLPV